MPVVQLAQISSSSSSSSSSSIAPPVTRYGFFSANATPQPKSGFQSRNSSSPSSETYSIDTLGNIIPLSFEDSTPVIGNYYLEGVVVTKTSDLISLYGPDSSGSGYSTNIYQVVNGSTLKLILAKSSFYSYQNTNLVYQATDSRYTFFCTQSGLSLWDDNSQSLTSVPIQSDNGQCAGYPVKDQFYFSALAAGTFTLNKASVNPDGTTSIKQIFSDISTASIYQIFQVGTNIVFVESSNYGMNPTLYGIDTNNVVTNLSQDFNLSGNSSIQVLFNGDTLNGQIFVQAVMLDTQAPITPMAINGANPQTTSTLLVHNFFYSTDGKSINKIQSVDTDQFNSISLIKSLDSLFFLKSQEIYYSDSSSFNQLWLLNPDLSLNYSFNLDQSVVNNQVNYVQHGTVISISKNIDKAYQTELVLPPTKISDILVDSRLSSYNVQTVYLYDFYGQVMFQGWTLGNSIGGIFSLDGLVWLINLLNINLSVENT